MTDRDIILAEALDCYVGIGYNPELSSIRFIKDKEKLAERKTHKASFELDEYFKGERTEFSCHVDISCLSSFVQNVLNETRKIEYGRTITYSELAERIGSRAVRAVGGALSKNPVPIVIPCHRIVAKNGIGGYTAGIDIKTRLLQMEQKTLCNNL